MYDFSLIWYILFCQLFKNVCNQCDWIFHFVFCKVFFFLLVNQICLHDIFCYEHKWTFSTEIHMNSKSCILVFDRFWAKRHSKFDNFFMIHWYSYQIIDFNSTPWIDTQIKCAPKNMFCFLRISHHNANFVASFFSFYSLERTKLCSISGSSFYDQSFGF